MMGMVCAATQRSVVQCFESFDRDDVACVEKRKRLRGSACWQIRAEI